MNTTTVTEFITAALDSLCSEGESSSSCSYDDSLLECLCNSFIDFIDLASHQLPIYAIQRHSTEISIQDAQKCIRRLWGGFPASNLNEGSSKVYSPIDSPSKESTEASKDTHDTAKPFEIGAERGSSDTTAYYRESNGRKLKRKAIEIDAEDTAISSLPQVGSGDHNAVSSTANLATNMAKRSAKEYCIAKPLVRKSPLQLTDVFDIPDASLHLHQSGHVGNGISESNLPRKTPSVMWDQANANVTMPRNHREAELQLEERISLEDNEQCADESGFCSDQSLEHELFSGLDEV